MLLEALRNFEWYNEPSNVVFRDKSMHVLAENRTDFWQSRSRNIHRDNGHFFFTRRTGDFTFVVKWNYEDSRPFDQCGLMLRIDEKNWVKASVMYDNPAQPMLGSSLTQNGISDWAAQNISQINGNIWFKLKRRQEDYMIYYSLDGETYKQIRMFSLAQDFPEVKVGAYICSPNNSEFEAVLQQLNFV